MTIFYPVMAVVVMVWVLVLIITIFNVLSAIKGKKDGEKQKTKSNISAAAINNVAGMPVQTYYSTYWTNTTTILH